MINVKDKTCEYKDCKTIPCYNFPGETRGRFCNKHKESGMIDIKHKKYEVKDCNISSETKEKNCDKHKENDMIGIIDVIHKRRKIVDESVDMEINCIEDREINNKRKLFEVEVLEIEKFHIENISRKRKKFE